MLIKFNPSIAGYAGNNIGTNKNMQGQPAFKAITARKAFEIGIKHGLPDHRAQQLIDRASNIERNIGDALKNLKRQSTKEKGPFKQAIDELLTHQA